MKKLNITLNFEVPEDYENHQASDLAYFIIDSIWDIVYEDGFLLKNFEIYEGSDLKRKVNYEMKGFEEYASE